MKDRLRAELLERRREMAFEEVYQVSLMIQKMFLESGLYASTGCLALYSSFRNEVLTDEVFRCAVSDGKDVYYPRIVKGGGRHLEFFKVTHPGELAPGSYEIPEPEGNDVKGAPGYFDLVVVPGVAFDLKGARLGYGQGYYDRALSGLKCPVVAFAYDFQVLDGEIPVEAHDVRMSAIVTERRVIAV